MRDIPIFMTKYGVASLTLKQIPYTSEAYIRLQDSQDAEKLLQECRDFCRAAGAEKIYAAGDPVVEKYPFHTMIMRMCCNRAQLPATDAITLQLNADVLEDWRKIYNDRMQNVPNRAFISAFDAESIMNEGSGYFVYRNSQRIGLGVAVGEQIHAVIATEPGAGKDVLSALSSRLNSEMVYVEVASENKRAIHLYHSLGFVTDNVLSVWHQIF